MNPVLGLGEGFLRVRQEYDPLARIEKPHVDLVPVALGNLRLEMMLVLLRFQIDIHLRPLERVHVFLDIGFVDLVRKHEGDHEAGVGDLAESQLRSRLVGDAPQAGRRHIAIHADIHPLPRQPDELEIYLVTGNERLQRLNRREMAARMITDGDFPARQVFGPPNIRVLGHHDAAGGHDVGAAPQPPDIARGRLVDSPMAGTADIGFAALVPFAGLVGFVRALLDLDHIPGLVDLLLPAGDFTARDLIVEAFIGKIPLLVSDRFLQPAMGLNNEF